MFDYELMQARDNQWGNYVNEEVCLYVHLIVLSADVCILHCKEGSMRYFSLRIIVFVIVCCVGAL